MPISFVSDNVNQFKILKNIQVLFETKENDLFKDMESILITSLKIFDLILACFLDFVSTDTSWQTQLPGAHELKPFSANTQIWP